MSNLMQYPQEQKSRSGCKVSWRYYDLKEDAIMCAVAARYNAKLLEKEGYDFGYNDPGFMVLMTEDDHYGRYTGLYQVCVC